MPDSSRPASIPRNPWRLDRLQADMLIATLALLSVVLLGWRAAALAGSRAPQPPARISTQGRLAELPLAAKRELGAQASAFMPRKDLRATAQGLPSPWDKALLSVMAEELQETELARQLALEGPLPPGSGAAFRQCWSKAYLDEGPMPSEGEREAVSRALGQGYGARLLEARLLEREGKDAKPLVKSASAWALRCLLGLWAAGMAVLFGVLGGLGFGVYLLIARLSGKDKGELPRPVPQYHMCGRTVLIVLLAWFNAFLLSGSVVGLAAHVLPFLKPVALPVSYGLHAGVGVALLASAEGITIRELWKQVAPGFRLAHLGWALGFLALALLCVLAVAGVFSIFARRMEPPQKELMDILSGARGLLPVTLLFLAVAGLAPCFEELIFRGFLLPWMGQRMEPRAGRRRAWTLAVLASGILFGAIHLNPVALPVLGTLGIVLGFAYLRAANLWSAILVHALWNAGQFIFMRLILS